jgi:hypothetical protein
MTKLRCPAVGTEFNLGYVNSLRTPSVFKRKGDIECPTCGKQIKQGTTVGEVQSYYNTRLFCYIRYHKAPAGDTNV